MKWTEELIKHKQRNVIYGAGTIGKNLEYFLRMSFGAVVDYFCDQNSQLWGKTVVNDILCISPEELSAQNSDCFVVIAVSFRYLKDVEQFFAQINVKYNLILPQLVKDTFLKKTFCQVEYLHMTDLDMPVIQSDHTQKQKRQISQKTAVYTFITEGYDTLHQPLVIDKNVDYFVISDYEIDNLGVYQWIDIKTVVPESIRDPFMQNRYCKMHGADIFRTYRYSIYLDGSLQIAGDIVSYLQQTGRTGIAMYLNETCTCIYETAILITLVGRCDLDFARRQMHSYAMEGMPAEYGLLCGGYIFRDNANELGNQLMHRWWEEYQRWPTRDQLCFTYVMWRMNLELKDIGILNHGQNRLEDKNILHHPHCYIKIYNQGSKPESEIKL